MPCRVGAKPRYLCAGLADHGSVVGEDTLGGELIGVGPPLVDLYQSRLDQVEPGENRATSSRVRDVCGVETFSL